MVDLFKVPVMLGKDGHQITVQILKSVLEKAFPDRELGSDPWRTRLDGVEFDIIGHGTWHDRFEGVQLKVSKWSLDARIIKRSPTKRVMLDVEGRIDLDAIRSKQTELAAVANTLKKQSDQVRAEATVRTDKLESLVKELRLRRWFPLSIGTNGTYSISLGGLAADDVREVVRLLRGLGVEDVQEETAE